MPPCTRWYDEATGCGATAGLGGKGRPARMVGVTECSKLPLLGTSTQGSPQGERLRVGRRVGRFRVGWLDGLGKGGEPYGSSWGPRGLGLTVWSLPCGEAWRNKIYRGPFGD
jgi:hypothetical protein